MLTVNAAAGTFSYTPAGSAATVVDVCAVAEKCKPGLVAGPGASQYTFTDGYGKSTVIDVNELDFDIKSVEVAGSVLTFAAENGTSAQIDICEIVGNNCNASLTANADGSFTHVDNKGVSTNIPAPAEVAPNTSTDGSITVNGDDLSVNFPDAAAPVTVASAAGTVDVTATPTGYNVEVPVQTPNTSTDGSITVNGDDLSVNFPDAMQPVTVASAAGTVDVTPTATGYNVEVEIPAAVPNTSTDGSITVTGDDLSVNFPTPAAPVTVASAAGTVNVTATATGYNVEVPAQTQTPNTSTDGSVTVDGDDLSVNFPPYTDAAGVALANNAAVLTTGAIRPPAAYAASNDAGCSADQGLPVGVAADGTLRAAPPVAHGENTVSIAGFTLFGISVTAVVDTDIVQLCATLTNTACFRAFSRGLYRTNVGFRMGRQLRQDYIITSSGATSAAQGSWSGVGAVQFETCNTNNCDVDYRIPMMEFHTGFINPNETGTICQVMTFSPAVYAESSFNQLKIGNSVITYSAQSYQGNF